MVLGVNVILVAVFLIVVLVIPGVLWFYLTQADTAMFKGDGTNG
jgi:hypothetical protein